MLRNPIDYSQSMIIPGNMEKAVDIVTDWDEVDLCIGFSNLSSFPSETFQFMVDDPNYLRNMYSTSRKPLIYITELSILPERQQKVYQIMHNLIQKNIPVYHSFSSAADALSQVIEHNRKKGL